MFITVYFQKDMGMTDNNNIPEDQLLALNDMTDEHDEEEDQPILEGLRRLRSQTNWRFRGTAMTVTEFLNIGDIQGRLEWMEDLAVTLGAIIVMKATKACSLLQDGLVELHKKTTKLVTFLQLSLHWITCYINMRYLDIEDRIYYQHTPRPWTNIRNRTIDSLLDDNESEELFGFKIDELNDLYTHLRIPEQFYSDSGHVFYGEEAMLVFLHYIRTGTTNTRMAEGIFGGDPRKFSYYIRSMSNHLYHNFYHKITGDSMQEWREDIDEYRAAIYDVLTDGFVEETHPDGSIINYEILIPFDRFRVFGWLDDTDMNTTRPRPARVTNNIEEETRDIQVAFYNRYFRAHGFKAQVLLLPNGMIGSIFICSLRHNDNGVQNLSGLNDYLMSVLQPLYYNNDIPVYPAVYGDAIFVPLTTIIRPYTNPNPEQMIINIRFSSMREDIEHKFSQIFNLYQVLRCSWRHRLFHNAEHVRKLFFCCLFMSNCYTCFNESRNRRFGLRAPTISQYLPIDEVLITAPNTEFMPLATQLV